MYNRTIKFYQLYLKENTTVDERNMNPEFVEEGITLTELFKIVWANIIIVFLITIWVTVIGVVYTYVIIEPTYTAEASITIQVDISATTSSDQSALSVSQNLVSMYKSFVVSDLVLDAVIASLAELNGVEANNLENSITISSVTSVPIIYIAVENEDPELAAAIANMLLLKSIEASDDFVLLRDKLRVLDVAKIPVVASAPNKMLNVVISFLIGGILSLGVVFLKELFNNKFQSAAEMENYLNINIIATVPGTIKERKLVD
jgi:capsular polysaccharide biosynthesis protein